jgi:hypothetical protein
MNSDKQNASVPITERPAMQTRLVSTGEISVPADPFITDRDICPQIRQINEI